MPWRCQTFHGGVKYSTKVVKLNGGVKYSTEVLKYSTEVSNIPWKYEMFHGGA